MNRRSFLTGVGALMGSTAVARVLPASALPVEKSYMVYSTGIESYSYIDIFDSENLYRCLAAQVHNTGELVSGELGQVNGVTFIEQEGEN